MLEKLHKNAWQRAKDFGIDISLLELNLGKSIQERIQEHQNALNLLFALEEASQKLYAGLQKTHRKSGRQRG